MKWFLFCDKIIIFEKIKYFDYDNVVKSGRYLIFIRNLIEEVGLMSHIHKTTIQLRKVVF